MKKVLFLSLLLFFSVLLSFASVEDENKETVEIESSVAEKDRSIYSVECTIDRLMHTIHHYYINEFDEKIYPYVFDVDDRIINNPREL